MKLEELAPGVQVSGVIPSDAVLVLAVTWHGANTVELTYQGGPARVGQCILTRGDEARLRPDQPNGRPFTANAADFKLAAEAQRIKLAGLHDPMVAVATSDVQPLPHQIRAVYGDMLPRSPLRFLLADDPGAGKTIMAGLYVKELILRDDVKRCLIVAPGGLVEQWQDELWFKFGLVFDLLSNDLIAANLGGSVFDSYPLLIARMDHLARNEDLRIKLDQSEWDLVIIDEAHRLGARYSSGKLEKTKRFQLGERLGKITRHFLLMTATPHAGKEEDFQLFLTLLDRDRFEGKYDRSMHGTDTTDLMRRMVKEDLLTFEGKPLFPERVAETVRYKLTPPEQELYEAVTRYVREGMNRAEKLNDKRRNTVGFALTVLQRRLASSPQAIYRSLVRRSERLEQRRQSVLSGTAVGHGPAVDLDVVDGDGYSAAEIEHLEDELVDAATAARTAEELAAELVDLQRLTQVAMKVQESGTDKKWDELRTILVRDAKILAARDGRSRKLIIFTEHRDTLEYLVGRIRSLLGKSTAVQAIHGGLNRAERRRVTSEFTSNPDCQVLLATDAAGEGLNLQVAHLMVNYDLPWNPNRIEQRFGRVHRIGQTEVCRLWNLVASTTREGAVFLRLLDKLEEQRKAYKGKVFDVLGQAFDDQPLRQLLVSAIQYGDQPEVRTQMNRVIDSTVSEGLKELLEKDALVQDHLAAPDLATLRAQMDEARTRRLQPHYIEGAFRTGFKKFGGRIVKREKGRFELPSVPAAIRNTAHGPVAQKYERVTFALEGLARPGESQAVLLAPGQALHDAVIDLAISSCQAALTSGSVLVSATLRDPHLLVGVEQQVVDGNEIPIARKFDYAYVTAEGVVSPAGSAPYLDCVAAPSTPVVDRARQLPWLGDAEAKATSFVITAELPAFVQEVQQRRSAELARTRLQVRARLEAEIGRLTSEGMMAAEQERAGRTPQESCDSLMRKAEDLRARLDTRLTELDRRAHLATKPPKVAGVALVIPLGWLENADQFELAPPSADAEELARRGIEAVFAAERAIGRTPIQQPLRNLGFDVVSHASERDPIRLLVKSRDAKGAWQDGDLHISHNEVVIGKNAAPRYRLALVAVNLDSSCPDEIRYLEGPFDSIDLGDLNVASFKLDWMKAWHRGRAPF